MSGPVREPVEVSWEYPSDLPVSAARDEILGALEQHQILILCGATGSGKSTQLPKMLLEAGRGTRGLIAHTQPRRLAARALAERLAEETRTPIGDLVGWQVRFHAETSDTTRVKLMTDGLLLAELRQDRQLRRYDTIIIDEAHERSLNIDFLLGYLHRLCRKRRDLKVVITSATLDAEKFSKHFDSAPVIDVPGRSHPVELRYRPFDGDDPNPAIVSALTELWRRESGDVLVFLPGEREIRDCADTLTGHPALAKFTDLQILPLYARLSANRQQAIFHPTGKRRVILATNVAETSVTVPGIRHVIDTGLARIARYHPRSQIQGLQVEPIAQASADQRKGRCGRTAPGVCIRLYAEDDFNTREVYTQPEIQRTNLATVVLQMADLGLGEPEDFPFVDAPASRITKDARRLLSQCQALDDDGITPLGRQMARLPLEPRFARILLAAHHGECLHHVLPIIAALSMQDPRDINAETRTQAQQAHAPFKHPQSDFLTLLNIWETAAEKRAELASSAYQRWCKQTYLHGRRMREWQDLVKQIQRDLHGLKITIEPTPRDDNAVHLALLHGLLDHIGMHTEDGGFRGPRGTTWRIHPESALRRSKASWVMAAEIATTTKTWARTVAAVQPDAIETAAAHLVRRSAREPYWDRPRGEVMAKEQVTLFGLPLISGRLVRMAAYDAQAARRLFIEEALVRGHWGVQQKPDFLVANLKLLKRLKAEEDRLRRRDIVLGEPELIDWYDARLPAQILSRRTLLRAQKKGDAGPWTMAENDVRASDAGQALDAFPGKLTIRDTAYTLKYHFAPGTAEDGVELRLPLAQLNQVVPEDFDWLVPGLIEDKLTAILKGLPKTERRRFVPVSDTVGKALATLGPDQGRLYPVLADWLQKHYRSDLSAAQLAAVELPDAMRMRFVVLDAHGKTLAQGRDLTALQDQFSSKAADTFHELHDDRYEADALGQFPPDPIPARVEIKRGLFAYPYLEDDGKQVNLRLTDDPLDAERKHRIGLRRLYRSVYRQSLDPLRRGLPDQAFVELRLSALPKPDADTLDRLHWLTADHTPSSLAEAVIARAIDAILLPNVDVRSRDEFDGRFETRRRELVDRIRRDWDAVAGAAKRWHELRPALEHCPARADIETHLSWLMAPDFVWRTPQLADLPRYLEATALRIGKASQNPAQDAERVRQIAPYWSAFLDLLERVAKRRRPAPPELVDLRWMLEEYRVSIFAQTIKTARKVSGKRLDEHLLRLRREL